MIQLENVSKSFRLKTGTKTVLDGLSMTIPRGRVVYQPRGDEFVIYLAPEIYRNSSACDAVVLFFRLQGQTLRWERDDHHYATQDDLIDEGDDFPDL